MSLYRGAGGASDATDDSTVNAVAEYAAQAASSASSASTSASSATTSSSSAATSATNAAASATLAATKAANAAASETNAAGYATLAGTRSGSAASSAAAASVSAGSASTSASNAASSASNAVTSASSAATSATNAATSATDAATSYANTLAIYGSTSAVTAAVNAAATSATNAATSASSASTSASNAASSATQASNYASQANIYNTSSEANASAAQSSANSASTSASSASTSASSASTSASSASTSAANAASSATSAANSATNAATSAASASTVSGSGNGTFNGTPITTNSTITISSGTANGVTYLNGSKVLTTGSALVYDGSIFYVNGAGGTRTADAASANGFEVVPGSTNNVLSYNRTSATYLDVRWRAGNQIWEVANAEQMRLTSTGLGIGTSSPGAKLHVYAGSGSVEEMIQTAGSASANLNLRNSDRYWTVTNQSGGSLLIFDTTAGATRMAFDTSGNVGIGTSSPAAKLNVVTTGGKSTIAIGDTAVSSYSQLLMYAGASKYNWSLGAQYNVDNSFEITPSTATAGTTFSNPVYSVTYLGSHKWFNGTTQAMTLDASGNLGVGTTSPTSFGAGAVMQTVAGTTGYGGYIGATTSVMVQMWANESGASASVGTRTNHPLLLTVNNVEKARIDTSGNLGLGGASFGSGAVVMFIANRTTAPTTNPVGGGILYVEAGALKYRGSSGTVTTLAAA